MAGCHCINIINIWLDFLEFYENTLLENMHSLLSVLWYIFRLPQCCLSTYHLVTCCLICVAAECIFRLLFLSLSPIFVSVIAV